uniref:Protein quiver n=1 Tax=Ditylenchus dipsaci TaxID=166011 RepID=A0A915D2G6_9BILA
MGVCEADFCFIEKKPTELSGIYRITKGCVKKPARTRSNLIGCDYDHYANHIQCICRGQWCHEISVTGNGNQKSGCGYGPPSLPYFYRGPELLFHRAKTCVTISRGNGIPHKYCICNTHLCNDYSRANTLPYFTGLGHKSRSIASSSSSGSYGHNRYAAMYECTNCDVTAEDIAVTSSCKQNRCTGHFCVYATQRIFASSAGGGTSGPRAISGQHNAPIIHVKQGCINVTDNSHIQLGCSHKWMNNEEEELYCACAGDNCNENLQSVSAASHLNSLNSKLIVLTFATLIMPFIVAFPSDLLYG